MKSVASGLAIVAMIAAGGYAAYYLASRFPASPKAS